VRYETNPDSFTGVWSCLRTCHRLSAHPEIKKAYDTFFANIKFSVEFKVLEVNVVAEEGAFASATSAGTTVVRGQENHESNHKLFVMQKMKGIWKIAPYCFSIMNSPK
jgi:ketosteroid isomerase-like protein